MPLLERYILRRIFGAFAATIAAFAALVWFTQALKQLDVVTANGQTILVYALMTSLAVPGMVSLIAPVAFVLAAVLTLNRLNSGSELAVMSATGAGRRTILRPLLVFAGLLTLVLGLIDNAAAPASMKQLRRLVVEARADLIATIIRPGEFHQVANGLTVYIRDKTQGGGLRGIFLNDARTPGLELQYLAESGEVVERDQNAFLVLQKGDLIRQRNDEPASIVQFESYAFDLSSLIASKGATSYKPFERGTSYLFDPDPDDFYYNRFRGRWRAELHNRLSAPLYPFTFALIVAAFFVVPRTTREGRTVSVAAAMTLAIGLRAGSFGAFALATATPAGVPLFYIVPTLGLAAAVAMITGNVKVQLPAVADRAVQRLGAWRMRRQATDPSYGGGPG